MIALAAERVRCGLGWLVWPWQPGCVLSVSLRLPAAEEAGLGKSMQVYASLGKSSQV